MNENIYIVCSFSCQSALLTVFDFISSTTGVGDVRIVFSNDKIIITSMNEVPVHIYLEIDTFKCFRYYYYHTSDYISFIIDCVKLKKAFKSDTHPGALTFDIRYDHEVKNYKITYANDSDQDHAGVLSYRLDETSEIQFQSNRMALYGDVDPRARITKKQFIDLLGKLDNIVICFYLLENGNIKFKSHSIDEVTDTKCEEDMYKIFSLENFLKYSYNGVDELSESIHEHEIKIGINPNPNSKAKRKSPVPALKKLSKISNTYLSLYFDHDKDPIIEISVGECGLLTCTFS